MLAQTFDQILPLIQLIQQPAFCIHEDGTLVCNQAAQVIAPANSEDLSHWLADNAEAYEAWDRCSHLVLLIKLQDQPFQLTVQALQDGTLFLLSCCETHAFHATSMAVAAQVLRQPLSEVCSIAQQLTENIEEMEDPILQNQTASMTRQLFRLNRIACDLADIELLRNGSYPCHLENLDLTAFCEELTMELTDICMDADFLLECSLPHSPVSVSADRILLERAIYNLVSNAMKYGQRNYPISFSLRFSDTAAYICVKNTCGSDHCDLLRAAFQRMEQRGMLPDPQWGIGLGLPLARSIAQLMGGTVAIEVDQSNIVSVTLSISRKRIPKTSDICRMPSYDYTGGMRRSMVELADILPDWCYDSSVI